MLRLDGGTRFLVLSRPSDDGHRLAVFHSFEEALKGWSGGARISPIFSTTAYSFPARFWLALTGPAHPGTLDEHCAHAVFLSLGLYNLLLVAESESALASVEREIQRLGVPAEIWHVDNGRILDVRFVRITAEVPPAVNIPLDVSPDALNEAAREYSLLVAMTAHRAAATVPDLLADLARLHSAFPQLLDALPSGTPITRQGALVNINAALSRFSSQTFAGTSPVFETECHYWTHSLLGVGTASLALVRLRQFVERVFAYRHRISERFEAAGALPSTSMPLGSLHATEPIWSHDHLFDTRVTSSLPSIDHPADRFPLVTFFSGRDGFRSTNLSLSGPLELLASCNTVAWTMLTITHELSHTIIADILGMLLPSPRDAAGTEALSALIADEVRPRTQLDLIRQYLGFAIMTIDSPTRQFVVNPTLVQQAIDKHFRELQEVMTHVFDFLYFYNSDALLYIKTLWVSWGTIPNIANRVPQYLLRSLCALYAANLTKLAPVDVSLGDLHSLLRRTAHEFPDTPYLSEAITDLTSRREYYKALLLNRSRYVRVVRTFLFSPVILGTLQEEAVASGGPHKGYKALRPLELADARLQNPIRFLTAFAQDKRADVHRTLWILHELAFGGTE